jgi:hypothetical protein
LATGDVCGHYTPGKHLDVYGGLQL